MKSKREFGREGEEIAQKYLKKNKYKIKDINFNCRFGEIDIVAIHKNMLVFIEVKARSSYLYGMPREAVDIKKQQKIIKTAQYYLINKRIFNDVPIRFDVVEVLADNSVVVWEDAFRVE